MLYGMPYPANDPKSGWSPVFSPIAAIIVAELPATGSALTGSFQGLEAGKIGQ